MIVEPSIVRTVSGLASSRSRGKNNSSSSMICYLILELPLVATIEF